MRNVRDDNSITLELFVPVNDTVAPVSSQVQHLRMTSPFVFSISKYFNMTHSEETGAITSASESEP